MDEKRNKSSLLFIQLGATSNKEKWERCRRRLTVKVQLAQYQRAGRRGFAGLCNDSRESSLPPDIPEPYNQTKAGDAKSACERNRGCLEKVEVSLLMAPRRRN